jgi:hypothetical protein
LTVSPESTVQDGALTSALATIQSVGVVTSELIDFAIETAITTIERFTPGAVVDREQLRKRLESVMNVFQPEAVELVDPEDHVPWLDTRRSTIEWTFNERYMRFLREVQHRPPNVLGTLDRVVSRILSNLEDPRRPGLWDRRGLVAGQVQSGKTANYVSLICRAADAGYGLIVILAGMDNDLRSQTQLRVDEGFLGFDTQKRQRTEEEGDFTHAALGVGRLHLAANPPVASLTTSAQNGDFLKSRASGVPINAGSMPVIAVLKKHVSILNSLREWVLDWAGSGEPRIVRQFPILVIDDEADNASISTANPFIGTAYSPNDVDPTKVNGAIRRLLLAFERRAYVGYTATPNACVFIPPEADHPTFGRDLFPRHFIETLLPPSNYFGPTKLFGLDPGDDSERPLVREICDYTTWLPDRHPNGTHLGLISESLRQAIRSFVLARAGRIARGERTSHNSMLVHVSRFQSVQDEVRKQIQEELDDLRGRINFGDHGGSDVLAELEDLWETDFLPTSHDYPDLDERLQLRWADVRPHLQEAVDPIETKLVNGLAKDALDYFDRRDTGLNVIAVGGNKLSRGLTLEGLTVSYYLRSANAHDTLFQMGRWFGYRDAYEDLCRLYVTDPLLNAFCGITEANEELYEDFREMADRGRTPSDYGVKIRDSVAGMLVTASNKMRTAQKVRIGFSGAGSETVAFRAETTRAEWNLGIAERFFAGLGAPNGQLDNGNWIWRAVEGGLVADAFFKRYESPQVAWRVQGDAISTYIEDRVAAGELIDWTIVLANSTAPNARQESIGGHEVGLVHRATYPKVGNKLPEGRWSIKQVKSPPDEYSDLTKDEVAAALQKTRDDWAANPGKRKAEPTTPSALDIRRVRDRTKGMLVVYPLEPPVLPLGVKSAVELTTRPIIGFLVSFPESPGAPTVDYQANRIFSIYSDLFAEEDDEGDDA